MDFFRGAISETAISSQVLKGRLTWDRDRHIFVCRTAKRIATWKKDRSVTQRPFPSNQSKKRCIRIRRSSISFVVCAKHLDNIDDDDGAIRAPLLAWLIAI